MNLNKQNYFNKVKHEQPSNQSYKYEEIELLKERYKSLYSKLKIQNTVFIDEEPETISFNSNRKLNFKQLMNSVKLFAMFNFLKCLLYSSYR